MDSGGIGWRELATLAAALAGIYLVIALMALARMKRQPPVAPSVEPTAPRDLMPHSDSRPSPKEAWQHPFLTPVELAMAEPPVLTDMELAMDERSAAGIAERPSASATPFAATLALTKLEAEVRQLRTDVALLRQELTELKEARRISPLYADAAALAHRGFDARGVADECGISVAEAELVLAMSRDDVNFDSEVEDGADGRKKDAAN